MQRDLVERRGWITEEDYDEGLALAQLAPGPLAAQLAIYLGWVRGRVLGATLVGARVRPAVVPDGARPRRRSTCATAACRGCRARSTASARR